MCDIYFSSSHYNCTVLCVFKLISYASVCVDIHVRFMTFCSAYCCEGSHYTILYVKFSLVVHLLVFCHQFKTFLKAYNMLVVNIVLFGM